jgi:hypothetical protein
MDEKEAEQQFDQFLEEFQDSAGAYAVRPLP